jgi:hypothetical protein
MTRVGRAIVGVALAVTGIAAVAAPSASPRGAARAGVFYTSCSFSHRGPDDPIVLPGRPGRSHDHTFVGNVSTNAFSTARKLLAAGTTCDRTADDSAYWAPTLVVDGTPFLPTAATIYYRRKTLKPVRPFPDGLKMVAGDSHAISPQPRSITFWACGVIKSTFYSRELQAAGGVPRCRPPATLELHVNFPDCWNGRSLDSPDHKSHMAYSQRRRCDPAHPVAVPAISLVYRYPTIPAHALVFLSSGGAYSGHADFLAAWHEPALAELVRSCLDEYRDCGARV